MEGNRREKRKQSEYCTTGGDGESSNSGECRINVEFRYEDKSIMVKASPNDTISDMRAVIDSIFDLSPSTQKILINRGMVLEDDMTTLRSVELQDTIQIRIFLRHTDQEVDIVQPAEYCTAAGGESSNSGKALITVELKYGEEKFTTVKAPPGATISDMKSVIMSLFDISDSNQKLITIIGAREIVLEDNMILKALALQLQDDKIEIRILVENNGKSRRLDSMVENGYIEIVEFAITKRCYNHWMNTGMIKLSGVYMKAIPEEVWNCRRRATLLDISTNKIEKIPAEVGDLTSLQTLLLQNNKLSSDKISWEALAKLRFLTIFNLSHNKLEVLPPALGALTSVRKLYVSHNLLSDIPTEIGLLSRLEILKVDNNRMSKIPASIGDCTCLSQVSLSSNLIVELPETICHLKNLKVLLLSKNSLMNSLPSTILETCSMLRRLEIDNTGIKIDTLHSFKGWADFDRRRYP